MGYDTTSGNHQEFAKVRVDFHPDGRVIPLKIRVGDEDAMIIDKILDVRRAASLKHGGQGIRYTCRIGEKRIYLFRDQDKWFVENLN